MEYVVATAEVVFGSVPGVAIMTESATTRIDLGLLGQVPEVSYKFSKVNV